MALVCCLYHAAHHLATACAPLHHCYFWSGDWNMWPQQKGRGSELCQFRKQKSGDCDTALWNFRGQTEGFWPMFTAVRGAFSQSVTFSADYTIHKVGCVNALPQHYHKDWCVQTFNTEQVRAQYVNSRRRWCHSVALSQLNHFLGLCVFLYPVWLTSGADLGHRMQ